MKAKILILCSLFFIAFLSTAFYLANLKRILRQIEKGNFERALELLQEELVEEPHNPGIKWIYADLLSTDTLPYYDLDLARTYIFQALDDYDSATNEFLEDFNDQGLDRNTLLSTNRKIRELSFLKIQALNTPEDYQQFFNWYPDSDLSTIAIKRRDSLAFLQTAKVNTWEAYSQYASQYPYSAYHREAMKRYHTLLYQDKTRLDRLNDYIEFVRSYPESPYLEEALEIIWKRSVITHTKAAFQEFIAAFPEAYSLKIKCLDYLFHLDPSTVYTYDAFSSHPRLDSLIELQQRANLSLFPVYLNNKLGFMDLESNWVIKPEWERLSETRGWCNHSQSTIYAVQNSLQSHLINRLGKKLKPRGFDAYQELGKGLLEISKDNKIEVWHLAGDLIFSNLDDVIALYDGQWLAVKQGDKWGIGTVTGEMLTPFSYDQIEQQGPFVIFQKGGRTGLSTYSAMIRATPKDPLPVILNYDEFEMINDTLVIGFNDDQEALLDQDQKVLIPLGLYEIVPGRIPYANKGDTYQLFDRNLISRLGGAGFNRIQVSDQWLAAKLKEWTLIGGEEEILLRALDTAYLVGDKMAYVADASRKAVLFANGKAIEISNEEILIRLIGTDEHQFLWMQEDDQTVVINPEADTLWSQDGLEEVSLLGDSLFLVEKGNRKGVVNQAGEIIIPIKYEALQLEDELIITLEDGNIGMYDVFAGVSIDPDYQSVFKKIGKYYRTRTSDGYGLLNEEGSEALDFNFKAIEFLNDSVVWTRTDSTWNVLHVPSQEILISGVLKYEMLPQKDESMIFRVLTRNGYGILDQTVQFLIPPEFSDIQGEGRPVFIAEKTFSEADYYIIIWYHRDGKKIFSFAYREEEYLQISCD
jgi:hypothetical protein